MILRVVILALVCFIMVVYPSGSTDSKNEDELINAIIKSLLDASTETVDVLSDLNALGPKSTILLKAIVPIAGLVLNKLVPEPTSDEYKMLIKLKLRTKEIWKDINSKINIANVAFADSFVFNNYKLRVVDQINDMKVLNKQYLDPEWYKDELFIQNFRTYCTTGQTAPIIILAYLLENLKTLCGNAIMPEEAEEIAQYRAHLIQVFRRFRVRRRPLPNPGPFLSEMIYIHKHSQLDALKEEFELPVFNRTFPNYHNAIEAYFDEVRARESIPKLKKVLKHFHRWNMCECKYTKRINEDVESVASFTSKWLNISLDAAWPSAHNTVLKEAIEENVKEHEQVDYVTLKTILQAANPILTKTGLPGFIYQFTIIPTKGENSDLFMNGTEKYCSHQKQIDGFDTLISRIRKRKNYIEDQVIKRMLDLNEEIGPMTETITTQMSSLYDEDKLEDIAKTLNENMKREIVSENNFHCWAIVRKWKYFCPSISFPLYSYSFGNLTSITAIEYQNRGWFYQKCEMVLLKTSVSILGFMKFEG
ncbi:unnamed protein product [Caenorhabditis angaria]|uniref:Uncharacterized protein n=1 Tax=Caenorhabditis angaria TaxID=860376 RepID=A0A9P1N9W9_9PELO|nr:unnamed protein product [Caenorhabditis angaria]